MAAPSYTYVITNGTTNDATQVTQNSNDILNGVTDGTKDLSINALTCAGTATLNGNINLGNAAGDDLTITASLASTLPIKTNNSFDIGSATLGLRKLYLGNGGAGATCDIVSASHATTREYTVPDCSLAANFVMTEAAQTINGAKTFAGQLIGKGTTTNDSPSAGYIGEVLKSAQAPSSTANTMSTGVGKSACTSISLTPGDRIVDAMGGIKPGVGTTVSYLRLGINTVADTTTADSAVCNPTSSGACSVQISLTSNASQFVTQIIPAYQVTVASGATQSLWLNIECGFAVSTANAFGSLQARRIR